MMNRILVTGANGFVGRALCEALSARDLPWRGAVRSGGGDAIAVGNLDGTTDWRAALAGCATVVHLAARVHVMNENVADPLAAFRTVNVAATLNLANQAVAAGVRRFVYVSSVKVNGEATDSKPFRGDDVPAPLDFYGQSKHEAELALRELAARTGLELVIVRPPLVYGPGVKANFRNLIRLVQLGLPLPLASIRNARSMVALDNLVDLLIACCTHLRAPGQVWMVSDGQDLSTPMLVRMIASALHKRSRLVPVPVGLMRACASVAGKGAVLDRLASSLQVDIEPTQSRLEWVPVISPQMAINATVAYFLAEQHEKHNEKSA